MQLNNGLDQANLETEAGLEQARMNVEQGQSPGLVPEQMTAPMVEPETMTPPEQTAEIPVSQEMPANPETEIPAAANVETVVEQPSTPETVTQTAAPAADNKLELENFADKTGKKPAIIRRMIEAGYPVVSLEEAKQAAKGNIKQATTWAGLAALRQHEREQQLARAGVTSEYLRVA